MYKIIQNYLQDGEYEYAMEYKTIADAQKDIQDYIKEDTKNGKAFEYTILDIDGEEIEDTMERDMYIDALLGIGLTEDEAERELEDLKL